MIDTIGFNDIFWFDGAGHPHTEKLHTIERIRRPDMGHLNIDITIEIRAPTRSRLPFGPRRAARQHRFDGIHL